MTVPQEYLDILRPIFETWAPAWEVWLFGSRATGHAHEGSDIDLLLRHPAEPERRCHHLTQILAAIHDSLLPIAYNVKDWATLGNEFRQRVEPDAVRLFAAKREDGV